MPLTELIRYFNAADRDGDSTLYADGRRVAAWHRGLKLASRFRPIADLRSGRIVGHEAVLIAFDEQGAAVDRETAYARHESGPAIVRFDRLCRTLHALNFLGQHDRIGGWLMMAVHPRHLLAVPGQHGLVYEAILKRCGLAPEDIALAVDLPAGPVDRHLRTALANYRQRGYRLALPAGTDAAATPALAPDILRCAPGGSDRPAGLPEETILEQSGIDSGQDLDTARAAGIALGSGQLFGEARENCLPTHGQPPLAYNSPSPIGVHAHENCQ